MSLIIALSRIVMAPLPISIIQLYEPGVVANFVRAEIAIREHHAGKMLGPRIAITETNDDLVRLRVADPRQVERVALPLESVGPSLIQTAHRLIFKAVVISQRSTSKDAGIPANPAMNGDECRDPVQS